jgi:hypothetical protein
MDTTSSSTSTGLLDIPDALLLHIVDCTEPQSIRRLKHINRKFSHLINIYRDQNAGDLASLPADLLLGILDLLEPCARSRLARTSYSFYSLVMDFVLCENIKQNNSSMLYWASSKDQKRLVRSLLERGADIDTEYGLEVGGTTYHFITTPLMEEEENTFQIAEMLLQAGADPDVELG